MVRTLALALFALTLATFATLSAEDKKKDEGKALEGVMVCAKCTLKDKDAKVCANALKVKEKDKEVIYYLDDKGGKETYHKAICTADTEQKVKVTGKVEEKDGKKWIKEPKVEIVK